jgi:hypothetical protein
MDIKTPAYFLLRAPRRQGKHLVKRSWAMRAAKGFTAVALACAGLAYFALPAYAHSNAVTGTATCGSTSAGGIDIVWTVTNDFSLSEVATVTSATGGLGTVTGSPTTVPANKSATITQVLPSSTTGPAVLVVKGVWSDNFTTTNTGSTPLPSGCPAPVQTLAGHIYLCSAGTSPTTTEVPGGTLAATGPQTVAATANPLAATNVAAGQYSVTATPPSGYELVTCGGSSAVAPGGGTATEAATVPAGGTAVAVFYVTALPSTAVGGSSGNGAPVSTASTPAAPATAAAAGSAVKSATSVHTGEPWAGSRPLVIGALLFGAGLVGAGAWARRRQTRVPAA